MSLNRRFGELEEKGKIVCSRISLSLSVPLKEQVRRTRRYSHDPFSTPIKVKTVSRRRHSICLPLLQQDSSARKLVQSKSTAPGSMPP